MDRAKIGQPRHQAVRDGIERRLVIQRLAERRRHLAEVAILLFLTALLSTFDLLSTN